MLRSLDLRRVSVRRSEFLRGLWSGFGVECNYTFIENPVKSSKRIGRHCEDRSHAAAKTVEESLSCDSVLRKYQLPNKASESFERDSIRRLRSLLSAMFAEAGNIPYPRYRNPGFESRRTHFFQRSHGKVYEG